MTRKDYNIIAYALAQVEPAEGQSVARAAWDAACKSVVQELKSDNPRFKPDMFLKACRFNYWKEKFARGGMRP